MRTTFVRLYERGLIYKGNRIINWCPRCATALSDLEVEHSEEEATLTYVKYPLAAQGGRGRRRAGVHRGGHHSARDDPGRYRHRREPGRIRATRTWSGGRRWCRRSAGVIPIVADEAVDPAFGSGAVKVTPGHDPTDFEIGLRHNLPIVLVIGTDDRMTAEAGKYAGMHEAGGTQGSGGGPEGRRAWC